MSRAETLAQLEALLAKPGGKQAVRFAINAIGGAIPLAGGVVSGVGSLWAEREQSQSSGKFLAWAQLADGEIARLSEAVSRLLAEPSPSSMALLLGEVLGDGVASQVLPAGGQVAVVLNPTTVAELEPFISREWLSLRSTGSVCSMGANNRVGNHIEELKRPYGLGNGFVLAVALQAQGGTARSCNLSALHAHISRWRLTPPSSGRSKGRFAPFGPPLMSNVGRHQPVECPMHTGIS